MDLEKSTSTTVSMKKLQDDGALPGRGTMQREAGEQPDKILEWTAKPALTPSLQSFIDIIDDLRERGLSGYEVAADFVGRRIQPLQARAHPAFDYSGPEDTTRVSPRGLDSNTVGRRVGQALPLTNVIGPLVDHQAATSLKESVAKEASDAVAATTSGSNVPKRVRKFSSVLGTRRKATNSADSDASPPPQRRQRLVTIGEKAARAKAAQGGTDAASSASPAATSTGVMVATKDQEAALSGPAVSLVPTRGLSTDALTWGELQAEMERILQASARGVGREIDEARAVALTANQHADQLACDLAEAREDLLKMRELVVGNEMQRRGLEHRMSELEGHMIDICGSLRMSFTSLHKLAGECGVTTTIPVHPDEFSLMSSLAELATAMEEIPSKHAARIGEETSNDIYTGACHVLACMRLAHPDLDHKRALDQGAVDDARKVTMEEVACDSEYFCCCKDVDVEDVQQHGQPDTLVVVLAITLEPHVPETKLEVAQLERAMVEVKKDQAVEALRGREVWFNSYLKSYCTAMAELDGIGKRIDEALKQECHRASRYTGGHVLACIRDHRPQLHLEFLHEGFSHSRRTPAEIDGLAQSMAPLAENVFCSMVWRWPSW
uniref:Uncharacterized protein n=1 Tax=Oryza meridionalis TaxID=40149 RepID=A0A0E0E973_9ORYZ